MKKITSALLMVTLLIICFLSTPKFISAQDTSVRDFVNLLISIGVIPQDKLQSVNDFLLTLESHDVSTTTNPIYDVEIATESNSARVDWKTNIVSESKLFIEGKTYFSERGVGTRHYVRVTGLESGLDYDGTITAIANNLWETKKINFTTEKTSLKITLLRQNCPSDSCIFGWETNYETDSKIKIYKKSNGELVKTVSSSARNSDSHQVEFVLDADTEYSYEIYADSGDAEAKISGHFRTGKISTGCNWNGGGINICVSA